MKKYFLITLLCSCFVNSWSQKVYFGERDSLNIDLEKSLFFDENGWVYPSIFISNKLMDSCGGNLQQLYLKSIKLRKEVCYKYQLIDTGNIDLLVLKINDSVKEIRLRELKKYYQNLNELRVWCHGFRKPFQSLSVSDFTSPVDYKEAISKIQKGPMNLPIDDLFIYWDGKYDCCFGTDFKKNKQLFHLFEEANKNAQKVGQKLGEILVEIPVKSYKLIAHSLGSKVLMHTFSAFKNLEASYSIKLVLFAPAMDKQFFIQNTYLLSNSIDFSALIFYNEKDFALLKKDNKFLLFGPGTKRYGNTSLGCNRYNEAIKLKKKYENSANRKISLVDKTTLGKKHSWRYFDEKDFAQVLEF